jgi:hypothetical protein
MSEELIEYIVTLKNKDDLDDFYDDMETPGGNLYIPSRTVEVANRRKISRNTHYYLTELEAEQIRNDARVLAVERLPKDLGVEAIRFWEQTADFEKSSTISSTDKNWGLLRVINGSHISGWGTDGSFAQITESIKTTSSGKNVDVVIVDAHINPNHPEFALNENGTGGSRVNLFDWYSLSNYLGYSTVGSYSYSSISSNHGTHVAGTVCGNTQGWARKSNIYNMEFNYAGSNALPNWQLYIFDYLRAFHLNKPINPTTGRRNPTITNHSWGYAYDPISLSIISGHTYRGVFTDISTLSTTDKKTSLEANGVPVPGNTFLFRMPFYYPALMSDVEDAINDGIIVVAAAGNSYWNTARPGDIDYDNSIRIFNTDYYHSRGSSPASGPTLATEITGGLAPTSISVGNISQLNSEVKNASSNYGNGVDIWAPGSNIISAVYNSTAASEFGITLANDPRNSNYKIGSISGTSMASPQVCGVLACYAEIDQNLNQQTALDYLLSTAKSGQLASVGTNYGNYFWFGDNGNNRYLFYKLERPLSGNTYPKKNFKSRPTNGITFPRSKIRRRG